MLRSTSSTGFPRDPPRPAGTAWIGRSRPPGHGPVVAARVPVTGRAGRGRSTRAGYLAKSRHHMLPASWRAFADSELDQPPRSRATARSYHGRAHGLPLTNFTFATAVS